MNSVQPYAALAGRILLAIIFIISGFGKISGYDGTAAYMAAKGMPMIGDNASLWPIVPRGDRPAVSRDVWPAIGTESHDPGRVSDHGCG